MKKLIGPPENPKANVTSIQPSTQIVESTESGSGKGSIQGFTHAFIANLRICVEKITPKFLMEHDKHIEKIKPSLYATMITLFSKNIIIKGNICWFDGCGRIDIRFIVKDLKDVWKPSCKYHSNIILKQLKGGYSV